MFENRGVSRDVSFQFIVRPGRPGNVAGNADHAAFDRLFDDFEGAALAIDDKRANFAGHAVCRAGAFGQRLGAPGEGQR